MWPPHLWKRFSRYGYTIAFFTASHFTNSVWKPLVLLSQVREDDIYQQCFCGNLRSTLGSGYARWDIKKAATWQTRQVAVFGILKDFWDIFGRANPRHPWPVSSILVMSLSVLWEMLQRSNPGQDGGPSWFGSPSVVKGFFKRTGARN